MDRTRPSVRSTSRRGHSTSTTTSPKHSPGFPTLSRFSASIGGGIKYYLADHFGLRLGARWLPVYVNSASSGYAYCDPLYGCYDYYNTNYLNQGDAYGGLILRF